MRTFYLSGNASALSLTSGQSIDIPKVKVIGNQGADNNKETLRITLIGSKAI
jgi:hypothetical protein